MKQSAFRGPDNYTSYSANEQLSCAITATLAAEQLNNFIIFCSAPCWSRPAMPSSGRWAWAPLKMDFSFDCELPLVQLESRT